MLHPSHQFEEGVAGQRVSISTLVALPCFGNNVCWAVVEVKGWAIDLPGFQVSLEGIVSFDGVAFEEADMQWGEKIVRLVAIDGEGASVELELVSEVL